MPTIEIYRARIDPANVDRLLEIRDAAVAEFREQVPELLQADLVRLHGDTWLDILTWSEPVDPKRIEQAAACTPTSAWGSKTRSSVRRCRSCGPVVLVDEAPE
jgi:hypothetical protein